MPKLLGIAVPTRGRPETLRRLLEGILYDYQALGQAAQSEVELCLSDNSKDRSSETVANELRQAGLPLVYKRNEEDVGFSENLKRAVSLSEAKYVYLCGDDDEWMDGSLAVLLSLVSCDKRIVLFNSQPSATTPNREINLPNLDSLFRELGLYHFTFIGNLLVQRAEFVRNMDQRFMASAYPHAFVAGNMLGLAGGLYYPRPIVRVDDTHREWTDSRYVYYGLDLPVVVTELFLRHPVSAGVRVKLYAKSLKSLPFAVWTQEQNRRSVSEFTTLSCRNVFCAYRGILAMAVLAVVVYWCARVTPAALLRCGLDWKRHKEQSDAKN